MYTYTLGPYSDLTFVRNEPRLGILLPMQETSCLCDRQVTIDVTEFVTRLGLIGGCSAGGFVILLFPAQSRMICLRNAC